MGIREQLLYLLVGAIFYLAIRSIAGITKAKLPDKLIGYVLFTGNLLLLAGNISISLYILGITSEAKPMSEVDVNQIYSLAHAFAVLAYIFGGAIITMIIVYLISAIHNKRKEDSNKAEIMVSTEKLDSITKEIESLGKVNDSLRAFFNKLLSIVSSASNTKKEQ